MRRTLFATAFALVAPIAFAQSAEPYLGYWQFTTPGGGAGWLGITQENNTLDAQILWQGGSVVPAGSIYVKDDLLHIVRVDGGFVYSCYPDLQKVNAWNIEATVDGDELHCTMFTQADGAGYKEETWTAKRIPALPDAPDLSQVEFGEPVSLIAEDSLDGWKPTDPNQTSGWRVEDGVLINEAMQKEGEPHIHYGNLRTADEFEDFNLKTDVYVEEHGNSGIYLRGVYEVQVEDSYSRPADWHGMGAIYSRVAPSVDAELPPGEWQTLDITLVDRHVTVKLNGTTIQDNTPLLGVTGGALWSDGTKPGPLYLQGDHTSVKYRNMVLTPVKK
jgi:hypothetical protein